MANSVENTRYENVVLQDKLTEALKSAISLSNYITMDDSLTENAGMTKTIHTYSSAGDVADVTEGNGNTSNITMSYTSKDYKVVTTQGRFQYTDEDEMGDPFLVDAGITDLGKKLTNKLIDKAVDEWEKATLTTTYTKGGVPTFDTIVDAIALLNKENDEEAGLFILVNPAMKAVLRKSLGDDLKYAESFARTGYIGTVCGVPVITSKAVADGELILASKKAVTCFVKKDSEIETDRDINTRINTVVGRFVNVVALTDANEVVLIAEAEA